MSGSEVEDSEQRGAYGLEENEEDQVTSAVLVLTPFVLTPLVFLYVIYDGFHVHWGSCS